MTPVDRNDRRRRRSLAMVVLTLVVAVVAGCGIPRDSEPREVTVDVDALGPTSSTSASSVPTGSAKIAVFFPIEGELLKQVTRTGESDTDPELALKVLMAGPKPEEREEFRISTFIPNGTEVLDTDRDGDTLIVNLNEGIDAIVGPNLTTAYAQMVWTATSVQGQPVTRVRFRVNGEDREAPTDVGQKDVVTNRDYDKPNRP
jgi:spore germination protein GerM